MLKVGGFEMRKQKLGQKCSGIQYMSMAMEIVCSIKMNIRQQENEKQPPTFSITRVQSGIENTL